MGGQACVFYGAAQFSKDVDFVLLGDEDNFDRLHAALSDLKADRIAVPPFAPEILATGHAVHYRCRIPEAEGLRVDVMTRLRDLDPFPELWERRATITLPTGEDCQLLSIPDLVKAKKTQREKDWPVITALVENHFVANDAEPTADRIEFWLSEIRTSERLIELTDRFPAETSSVLPRRPLLAHAISGDLDALRTDLDAEVRTEQAKDRAYWEPLKRELEAFRRAERGTL